jgi:hypothetical protein
VHLGQLDHFAAQDKAGKLAAQALQNMCMLHVMS